ncbi:hypothetical protein, partial [Bacillus thuringiensis]|uniref:hypothetical protein n=1 Tax=Bacillus thuringiensis TaxID=1428 RepID=UPI001C92F960
CVEFYGIGVGVLFYVCEVQLVGISYGNEGFYMVDNCIEDWLRIRCYMNLAEVRLCKQEM